MLEDKLWMRVGTNLPDHPRLMTFARRLGVDKRVAIGSLVMLWSWAQRYAPDGDLGTHEHDTVADVMGYAGDSEALWSALVTAGWVDADGRLHKWDDWGGRMFAERATTSAKVARHRERASSETSSDVVPVAQPSGNRPVTVTSPLPSYRERDRDKESLSHSRAGQVLDRIKARHPDRVPLLTKVETTKLCDSSLSDADLDAVADMWCEILDGTYGDDYQHDNLSINVVIAGLRAYQGRGEVRPAKAARQSGPVAPKLSDEQRRNLKAIAREGHTVAAQCVAAMNAAGSMPADLHGIALQVLGIADPPRAVIDGHARIVSLDSRRIAQ